MKIEPTRNNVSFGWSIRQSVTRYGKSMMKATEYRPDNGKKLLVVDSYRNGELTTRTKELYDKAWRLIGRKLIEFTNGKKSGTFYI